ncbi:olfactory receptor 1052-like [Coregonus clupeaformis]|uniref:olfactory receptor 1052-like n=1 Tax=Coregonus clupeaformis TaxID=59861 RepID=UPI001BDFFD55|nr:olfactory receptor 1052-like [Coregonus clupeaformis]
MQKGLSEMLSGSLAQRSEQHPAQPCHRLHHPGLASLVENRMVLFVIFLLAFSIILGGNIIYLVQTDPKLGSPMYFFFHNLSFMDMVYTTVTIPNMLSGFLTEVKTVSVPGCFLQMYCLIQMAVNNRTLLTVMAYDSYVAICNSLRYAAVMTRPVRLLLIIGAWTLGAICTLPATTMATRRSYCRPNVVRHCLCDPSSVRRLVCGDTDGQYHVGTGGSVAIAKMGAAQRLKAFTTCAAHLTVGSISYSSNSFVYIYYRVGNFSPEVCIIVSVLYSALTPFLNPIIYSIRNTLLREAIKRAFCQHRAISPQGR